MAIFHKTLQYHEDTTEKRDISQEDIEFLKKLQLEMNTQDTTGTADPRFWVIKGSERVVDNEDPDELVLQVDGSTVTSTTEETVKYLNDNILPDCNIDRENCKIETGYTWDFKLTYTEDGEEEYEDLSTQEVNEFLANNGYDDVMIIGISIRPFMYPNTMFLTEKEAREHLKRNYYHYSEDAHTYCMVAWRSPEVEKLWKILRETKWDCKDKEIESHEEKYILHYCISLMQELVGCFEEWYRWVHGENAIEELSEEERSAITCRISILSRNCFCFAHHILEEHQRGQNADSLVLIAVKMSNSNSVRKKMDKSIIMFDTPDSCGECFCQKGYTVYGYACGLTNRMNKDARCRPGWCPLIPLPERHIASKTATGYEIGYEDGWNECLEKIVGGE